MSNYYQQFRENKRRIDEIKSLLDNDQLSASEKLVYQHEYEELLLSNKEVFDRLTEKINNKVNDVLNVILSEEISNVNSLIIELDNDFSELLGVVNDLIADLDDLRAKFDADLLSIDPREIRVEITNFRQRIRNLKQRQIDNYNDAVGIVNSIIPVLRQADVRTEELIKEINALAIMDYCGIRISKYDQRNYLGELNYNKLKDTYEKADSLEKRVRDEKEHESDIWLDANLKYILEQRLVSFEEAARNGNLGYDDVTALKSKISFFRDTTLHYFKEKLEFKKSILTEGEYDYYINQLKQVDTKLDSLISGLDSRLKPVNYKEMAKKVDSLCTEVAEAIQIIDALCSRKINRGRAVFLNEGLDDYEASIYKLSTEIVEFEFAEKNQRDALGFKLRDTLNLILVSKDKVNNSILREEVLFVELDNPFTSIDTVESLLQSLFYEVTSEDVITDKLKRKEIENRLNLLRGDLLTIESTNRMDDMLLKRINSARAKADVVEECYLERCPLVVKNIRSAEEIYKEHDKLILLASGLAMLGLSFANSIGRILMVAIILGNVILSDREPVMEKINNIIGKLIRAQKDENGEWILQNGVKASSKSAANALLKSISLIEMPEVIQELIERVKVLSSKMSIKERYSKIKQDIKNDVDAVLLYNLYQEYLESGKDIDEFITSLGLSQLECNNFRNYVMETEGTDKGASHGR